MTICPFMRPWPNPQVWQHLNVYVPEVCARNSIVVVSAFFNCQQSCCDVRTRPAEPSESAPSGTVPILKPWSWSVAVILSWTLDPLFTWTGDGKYSDFFAVISIVWTFSSYATTRLGCKRDTASANGKVAAIYSNDRVAILFIQAPDGSIGHHNLVAVQH